MAKVENQFFESDAEIAEFLGMGISEFLNLRSRGKFGVMPRPRDARRVYWRDDVVRWVNEGRPVMAGRGNIGEETPGHERTEDHGN